VAIALREYPKLSDRAIAEMCAVSDRFVNDMRRALSPGANYSHLLTPTGCNDYTLRTGRDGKQYPAHPKAAPHTTGTGSVEAPATPAPADPPKRKLGPPSLGMQFARMAVMDLEERMP
jgi:hypothetical protein